MTGPAGNPECVWVGRRVVHRLFQDDLDTAFRHMDLYDRFGCPGGHIQAAFRCVVMQGPIVDAKAQENILSRVHSCWVNPASPPCSVRGRDNAADRNHNAIVGVNDARNGVTRHQFAMPRCD